MLEKSVLVKRAGESGIRLTRERLSKWQREGLIEPAKRVYGEGRGARAYYADDTLERVKIITQALEYRRDLDTARLALWRARYPVDMTPLFKRAIKEVRKFQNRIAEDREALKQYVESDNESLSDNYLTVDELPEDWHKLPLLRELRGSLKGKDIDYSDLVFLATIAHEPEDTHAPEDASYEQLAALRGLASLAGLSFDENPMQLLALVRPHLMADNLEDVLTSSSNDARWQADRKMRLMCTVIDGAVQVYQVLKHREPRPVIEFEQYPPVLQAWLVLVFHSFMLSSRLHEGFKTIQQAQLSS